MIINVCVCLNCMHWVWLCKHTHTQSVCLHRLGILGLSMLRNTCFFYLRVRTYKFQEKFHIFPSSIQGGRLKRRAQSNIWAGHSAGEVWMVERREREREHSDKDYNYSSTIDHHWKDWELMTRNKLHQARTQPGCEPPALVGKTKAQSNVTRLTSFFNWNDTLLIESS